MNWVLLHGFVGSSQDFDPLRRHLGPDGHVLAPDWPGHGTRAGLRSPADYTLEAHLRLIDASVEATSGPVTLVGYSMGGRMLQHWLASRRPALPDGSRLALVSTGPGIADPAERANRVAGDAAVARLLRQEGVARFLHYWHWQTMFQPMMRLPREVLAPVLRRRGASDPEGLALSLEGVGAGALADTTEALADTNHPTLLVAGELDPLYVGHARSMAARRPGARVHIVAGAGHAVHIERPESLGAALRDPLF